MINKYKEYVVLQGYKSKVEDWVKINLNNFLKKNEENQGEIEHILDFLNSEKAPKRIKYMSYEEAKKGAEKWIKTLNKKAANIVETEEDVVVIKTYNNGLQLVKLVGKNAFAREGKLMSHCVRSYYGKEGIDIYSIRDSKNMPHCTIEVVKDDRGVNQIKGKGNGSIHPRYIEVVLKSLKKIGKEVRSSEMRNLGYDELDCDTKTFLYKFFKKKSIGTLTYSNTQYFYRYSKLERKT